MPSSSSNSLTSSNPSILFPMVLVILLSAFILPSIHAGTWLSFNQNTGGMELADRFLGGPFRGGKSIADVVASGEMDPEDNQLASLFRMCRERVKRSSQPVATNIEQLDDLCSALLQLTKGQQLQQHKLMRKRAGGRGSRFVPIRMDEELLWL